MKRSTHHPQSKNWRGLPVNCGQFTGCPASASISEHLYMLPSLCCVFGVVAGLGAAKSGAFLLLDLVGRHRGTMH